MVLAVSALHLAPWGHRGQPVRALEFDARAVRALCDEGPELGSALNHCVADIIAQRLNATRRRLLDLYGPQGGGPRQ